MVQNPPGDNTSTASRRQGLPLSGGAIASIAGIGLLVIVLIQNTQRVQIDFLFWSFTWPIWIFALAMAVLGAVVWFGLGVMRRHRRRVARRG